MVDPLLKFVSGKCYSRFDRVLPAKILRRVVFPVTVASTVQLFYLGRFFNFFLVHFSFISRQIEENERQYEIVLRALLPTVS